MSKKITPQGNIESEQSLENKKVRTPILTQNLSGAKVNPQGYLYKEEEIDGTIGYIPVVLLESDGNSGTVTSVNTKTGDVVLNAADVGAEPTFAKNTAFNKNFGTTAGTVAQGSDLVNADWNAASGLAQILNKPGLQQITDVNNITTKTIVGKSATIPSGPAYTKGNYLSEITKSEYDLGNRPGYGFHTPGVFGIFLYGDNVNTLKKVTSSGITTTLWDSSNLPYEKGVWPPTAHTSGIAFTVNNAEYLRIGGFINIYCDLTITSDGTTTTQFALKGLPFVPKGSAKLGHCLIKGVTGFEGTLCNVGAGATVVFPAYRPAVSNFNITAIQNNHLKTGMQVFLDFEYLI